MNVQRSISAKHRRALRLLAGNPRGCRAAGARRDMTNPAASGVRSARIAARRPLCLGESVRGRAFAFQDPQYAMAAVRPRRSEPSRLEGRDRVVDPPDIGLAPGKPSRRTDPADLFGATDDISWSSAGDPRRRKHGVDARRRQPSRAISTTALDGGLRLSAHFVDIGRRASGPYTGRI
jgi:hypothetical protein